MVQTVKSVLLFDYDSIYRSLSEKAPGVGDLLGARAGVWLEAIEGGDIVEASYLAPDARRRFQLKRCYAEPKLLGKNRGWLTANGVQIVDCTPSSGLPHGAADIHLVLDALDAAEAEPDEIIILSAETDLTPLLFRLRASNQKVLIYVTDETAVSYRTFADGTIDEDRLVQVLAQPSEIYAMPEKGSIPRPPRIATPSKPERIAEPSAARPPQPQPARAEARSTRPATDAATRPVDREALAALVRRIHEATNVPLFSPRAFADLFRLITEEVAESGYKFSATTDHVTNRMNKLGRNVSKRQVGFVIKGLTLRGHVFSKDDAPEALAAIFHEQVLYLVETSDLKVGPVETGLIQAWIAGGRSEAAESPRPRTAPRGSAPPSSAEPRPVRPAEGASSGRDRQFRVRPTSEAPAADPTGRPASGERPQPSMRTASRPVRVTDDVRASEPAATESFARRVSRNGAAAAPPRVRPPPATPDVDTLRDAELEDSILSAIADAVDVLADDGEPNPPAPGTRSAARRGATIAPEVEPPSASRADDDAEDEIGDEIQRILSSYSQDR